jgi:hypothetical protein
MTRRTQEQKRLLSERVVHLSNDYDPDGDVILVGLFDPSGLDGILSNTNISAGTFTYTLETDRGMRQTGRMVYIRP